MQAQNESRLTSQATPQRVSPRARRLGAIGRCLRQGLCAALFGMVGVLPSLAAAPRLPALCDPASTEHHAGKAVFVELVTPDLSAAKQFYGGLFGWTFREQQAGGARYAQAYLEGLPVAGLFHKELNAASQRRPAWLTFFSVADVDAAKKLALQNGAKVLFEPRDAPDRGREAVFADPQGAVFAVLASGSGDPPDVLAGEGEWIWSSLITSDPEHAAAFYQKLFNYEVFELPAAPGVEHLLFSSGDYARASVNSLPAERPKAYPHWLNFVRVADADQSAAKVLALGGRVLVAPHADRQGGKVAVVADPQGATFGLLEWPEGESKEVPSE